MKPRNRKPEEIASWVHAQEFPGREYRVHVSMPASVEIAPVQYFTAEILDLSTNGFRLECRQQLFVGQTVRLLTRRDEILGEIHWTDGFQAGGSFTRSTHDGQIGKAA